MEAQQGIIYRLALKVEEILSIPLSDLMVPNPTQVQLKAFGDVVLGLFGLQITVQEDWVTTRTLIPSSGFGPTPLVTEYYRTKRIGDTLQFNGSFRLGVPTAAQAYIGLNGLKIDYTKVNPGNQRDMLGKWHKLEDSAGLEAIQGIGGQGGALFADGSDQDNVYLGYRSLLEHFDKFNVNAIWTATEHITFNGEVPIAGWKTHQTIREYLESQGVL